MKKSITASSKQIKTKSKILKFPSHQINNSNNINNPKNSSLSLMTSPNNSNKNLKAERVLSPINQANEKTANNKQKLKNIKILSPNNKKKS